MGIEELLIERAKHYGRLEGKAEGKIEGKAETEEIISTRVVEKLISNFGFTNEQAADTTGVSLEFVKKVRAKLDKR